jgi:hypothetical protein
VSDKIFHSIMSSGAIEVIEPPIYSGFTVTKGGYKKVTLNEKKAIQDKKKRNPRVKRSQHNIKNMEELSKICGGGGKFSPGFANRIRHDTTRTVHEREQKVKETVDGS